MKSKLFILFLAFVCSPADYAQQGSSFDSVFTNYFRLDSGGWTAGDATISVPLPDHRVIWLFGDSYIVNVDTSDNTLPCLFQVRNCMMVQDSVNRAHFKTIIDTTQNGVNRTPFKLVPDDTTLFWPGHGYVWNDTVYLFMERYSNVNMGLYYGEYIAKLHYPDLHMTGMYPVYPLTSSIFGRAVVADSANNYLYIYGNRLNWIVWEPIVARCRPDNPLTGWEFYTGTGWSSFPGQSQKIMDDPVSPGFSVIRWQGRYYLVTQENGYLECGLGRQIYSYTSDSPTGPFRYKKLLYTEESKFKGNYLLTYNAQAHPYFIENNDLLISYNVNDKVDSVMPNVCPSECVNIFTDRLDADSYRPKFIRVPMDLIAGLPAYPGSTGISAEPNPVEQNSKFNIVLPAVYEGDIHLSIITLTGRVIMEKHTMTTSRNHMVNLDAPSTPGIFILKVTAGESFQSVLKLVVI